ncbi:hypothetical protein Chor_011623 [Crotalus horridus]
MTLTRFLDLEVDVEDVKNLVAYTEGDLSNEDLIELKEELEAQKIVEEEVEKEERKEERKERKEERKVIEVRPKTFSLRRLASVFSSVNKILSELESMDPDVERFRRVHWEMCEILKCYREIYEGKKKEKNDKENKQNGLLKKATPSPAPLPFLLPFQSTGIQNPDPQPSTSYASIPIPALYDTNISQIGGRGLGDCEEYEGYGTTHKKTFQVGRSEEVDLGRFH